MTMNIYQAIILDHYKYPRNKGLLSDPDVSYTLHNSSCGDSVTVTAHVKGTVVTAIMAQAQGCVLSQASASILTERAVNNTIDTILEFALTDLYPDGSVQLGPVRARCALLTLSALQHALIEYKKGQ